MTEHIEDHLSKQIDIERITANSLRTLLAERDKMLSEFACEMQLALADSQVRAAMSAVGRTKCLELLQRYNQR